jgi:hypothetical protein
MWMLLKKCWPPSARNVKAEALNVIEAVNPRITAAGDPGWKAALTAVAELHRQVAALDVNACSGRECVRHVLVAMETARKGWTGSEFDDEYSFARAWMGTAISDVHICFRDRGWLRD